jgi:3-deoxy-D-manno-octulosonate 8-phosphate phosphatase (KDO 8-P phosphatase)
LPGDPKVSPALKKRAAQIKLLLMDVDGTMTDGSVTLLSQTEDTALEIKTFDAHDGQGLILAQTAGLRIGCITGRKSAALLRRAHEMKMEFIYMKQPVKMLAYEEILEKAGVSDSAVAYIGDDLADIPLMRRAGLAIAVGDASPEVKEAPHYITNARDMEATSLVTVHRTTLCRPRGASVSASSTSESMSKRSLSISDISR